MSWLKLDDRFGQHPKIIGLSDKAFRLHVLGMGYCAQHLTDGTIPKAALPVLGATARTVDELAAAGLWIDEGAAWAVHDYLEYNPPRTRVLAEREAAKQRMQRRRSPEQTANERRTFADCSPSRGSASPTRPDPKGRGRVSEEPRAVSVSPAPAGGDTRLDDEQVRLNVTQINAVRGLLRGEAS